MTDVYFRKCSVILPYYASCPKRLDHFISLTKHSYINYDVTAVIVDDLPFYQLLQDYCVSHKLTYGLIHVTSKESLYSCVKNLAVMGSYGEFLAFIDVCTTPPSNWLERCIAGAVTLPADLVVSEQIANAQIDQTWAECFVVRRWVWERIGGFNPAFNNCRNMSIYDFSTRAHIHATATHSKYGLNLQTSFPNDDRMVPWADMSKHGRLQLSIKHLQFETFKSTVIK